MRTAILAVVAVVAVVGGIVFGISRVADVSPLDAETPEEERAAASAWEAEAGEAFRDERFGARVIDMVEGAREWLEGKRPTERYRAELGSMAEEMRRVEAAMRTLREFPYDERVNDLYLHSTVLYSQTVTVYQAMLDAGSPAVRRQLDLLARRVRILGDRVFDRGRELVKPRLHELPRPGMTVNLPEEVPDWVQEGIAPGPPLEPEEPPAGDGRPRVRLDSRPSQARGAWLKAVRGLDLPRQSAIRDGDVGSMAALARRLVGAAEVLRGVPDPVGDRELSARVRLGLLADADAARARQLGLDGVADALLRVGADLWDEPGLPSRA